jgi:branched-chain amino acid aminotransferase
VEHNAKLIESHSDLGLVLFATPGPLGRYFGQAFDGPPTFGMHTFPLQFARYRHLFAEGARLVIPRTKHVPDGSISRWAKHRSRMHWWIATRETADTDPLAEPLLLDATGFVTETSSANVVAVVDGGLVTPPDCLPGISLQVIRELAKGQGLLWCERSLTVDQCLIADELFLTSTTFGIAGVSRFVNKPIPWPGPTFHRLLGAYSQLVGLDIAQQIMKSA